MWPYHSVSMGRLASVLAISSSALFGFSAAQQKCNGYAEYCDRIYSNVSFVGTHDSAFVGSIIDPTINQEVSVTDQLNAGIRFLQAQTHKDLAGTALEMCHTSCLEEDSGSLVNYLNTVKSWLEADGNENEVLTMLLTNGDYVDVTWFEAAFNSSGSGIDQYTFVPSTSPNTLSISAWPTYSQLIAAGTRLIVFLDYDANESVVPYIMNEFAYFFETPYDTTDPTFPECSLNRPPGASPDGLMYIVNHFLDLDILGIDIPDNAADTTTNAATGSGSIGAQADLCESIYGRWPNFVLVDMFNRGNVFAWQDAVNGVAS